MPAAVVDDVLVDLVGVGPGAEFTAESTDRLQFLAGEDFSAWIRRSADDDSSRARSERGAQLIEVDLPRRLLQRNELHGDAENLQSVEVVAVVRLEEDHFV